MLKKNIFLSTSCKSSEEQAFLEDIQHSLLNNDTVNKIYLDNRAVESSKRYQDDRELQKSKINYQLELLNHSDILVAMMTPDHESSSVIMEVGMAIEAHKPVLLVLPNKMFQKDNHDKINPILECKATDVINVTHLMYYDFTSLKI